MKNLKRIASFLLALVMVLSLSVSAFADLVEISENTGSILIKDNDTVKASLKNFAAHKILDLRAYKDESGDIKSYDYYVPAALADFYAARYNLDKSAADFDAKVVANINAEEDIYAFAEAVLTETKKPDSGALAPFNGKAVENGFEFTQLPLGYYVIEDITTTGDFVKPVSALILDTATPNVQIKIKAEKPPVEKKIDEDNNLDTITDRVDANQAAIGDTVTYVITSKVPDMTGYKEYFFIMQDTMSNGLTYQNNLNITVGDKVLTANTDYTATVTKNDDGTTSLMIVFKNFLQYNTETYIDKPITVTYTAELNEDAVINPDANTNEVYLQYSHNPNVDYEGVDKPTPEDEKTEPLGKTPEDEVKTYTTALEIIKTDPLGNPLTGAEFTLTGEKLNIVRVEKETFVEDEEGDHWKLKDGTYTTDDPNSTIDGNPVDKTKYESETKKYAKKTTVEIKNTKEDVDITATVGTDGTLRFEGLSAGTYKITETKAPEGYNILTKELDVKIEWTEKDGFTFEGASTDSNNNGIADVTVINKNGTELPETGGMGTTMLYVVGGIMVLAAIVLLITKKRMHAAE